MKKKVLVSSCLLGQPVRYDGRDSASCVDPTSRWRELASIVPFCPEVAAGLPTPRPAVEIIQRSPLRLADQAQQDYTAQFLYGAQLALQKALAENVSCALLKSKSPSCGFGQVYSGQFNDLLVEGDGLTAALFKAHHILLFNEHQLLELEDYLQNN